MRDIRIVLTLLIAAVMLNAGISAYHASPAKLGIAVSTEDLASVVKFIGGDYVNVKVLIPPGTDPHHYELTENQLISILSGTSLVVLSGPSHLVIEERIKELTQYSIINALVVDYRDYVHWGLKLLTTKAGGVNPHGYTYSLTGLKSVAEAVAHALKDLDPGNSAYYEARLDAYLRNLEGVKEVINELNVGRVNTVLLTPVLQYLVNDINVTLVDVILPELDVEPSESDVNKLVSYVRNGYADLILLSDLEAMKFSKLVNVLMTEKVPYTVIPVLKMVSNPHLIPLVASLSIKSATLGTNLVGSSEVGGDPLKYASLAANALLALMLILTLRVRR